MLESWPNARSSQKQVNPKTELCCSKFPTFLKTAQSPQNDFTRKWIQHSVEAHIRSHTQRLLLDKTLVNRRVVSHFEQ